MAYDNYAQRLASIFEANREPDDFIRADAEFKRLIKKGDCTTEDYRLYGILHQYMMQYCIQKAIEWFDRVEKAGPEENAEDWICLIAAYRYHGEEQKTYEWFLKAIKKFPEKAALYVYGGDACKKLGRYEEAFSHWKKALQIDPSFHDAKYSKGFCYEELGDFQKAYDCPPIPRKSYKIGFSRSTQFWNAKGSLQTRLLGSLLVGITI